MDYVGFFNAVKYLIQDMSVFRLSSGLCHDIKYHRKTKSGKMISILNLCLTTHDVPHFTCSTAMHKLIDLRVEVHMLAFFKQTIFSSSFYRAQNIPIQSANHCEWKPNYLTLH